MSSQVKVCLHGLGSLSCAACDVAPTLKFVVQSFPGRTIPAWPSQMGYSAHGPEGFLLRGFRTCNSTSTSVLWQEFSWPRDLCMHFTDQGALNGAEDSSSLHTLSVFNFTSTLDLWSRDFFGRLFMHGCYR